MWQQHYLLAVYCLLAWSQGAVWAIWGPISASVKDLYGFSSDDVTWLLNLGCLGYFLLALPFAYFVDRSLRGAMIVASMLSALSGLLRVIAEATIADATGVTMSACMYTSALLNAFVGPVAMGAVAQLSQNWFSAEHRATATAIGAEANLAGAASAFLIGPYILSEDATRAEAMNLWIGMAVPSCIVCVAALIFFPSAPAIPPSRSAEQQAREPWSVAKWRSALRALFSNKRFWVLCLSYGLSTGVFSGWTTALSINLGAQGFGQRHAGWIGFASIMAGTVGGVIVGHYAGRLQRLKACLVGLLVLGGVSALVFALAFTPTSDGWLFPKSLTLLFVSGTVAGFAMDSSVPLYFELSAENTFPIGEGVVGIALTTFNNIGSMIFYFVPIRNTGTAWMNWTLFAMCVACAVGVAVTPMEYRRREVDRGGKADSDSDVQQPLIVQERGEMEAKQQQHMQQQTSLSLEFDRLDNGHPGP